jgi:hypothetical protein
VQRQAERQTSEFTIGGIAAVTKYAPRLISMNVTTGWRTTPRRADDNTLMTRRAHLEGSPRRSPRRQLHVTMRTAPVQTRNAPHLSPERPTQVRRAAPPPIHLASH